MWICCMFAALFVSSYYLGAFRPLSKLGLTVSPVDVHGNVQVTCRNETASSITMLVPETPGAMSVSQSGHYALAVYYHETTDGKYHLLPPVPGAWTYQGVTLQETTTITLEPSLTCQLTLSPANIQQTTGANVSQLRLVLAKTEGSVTASCEIHVP